MRYPGFIGPSYTLDSSDIDSQRLINWYPKINEMGKGKSGEVAALYPTPGLKKRATVGTGPIRGSFRASNGFYYVVSGNKLFYVDQNFVSLEIGELATSSGNVDFDDNGSVLVIVDGDNGYWHTFSSRTLTKITDSAWLGSNRVNYIDGYFLFNDPGTGKFYISELNSINLNALDFASADGAPDNIVATLVNHREVWLFGEDSIESWYNTGNSDFPFGRVSGGFIEMGLAAAFSVAKVDRWTLWLGKNKEGQGIVYAAQGLAPQRISTHAVELAIQSYGDISDATAWTYQQNGHSFYVLNFTSANTTWVYDLNTRLWHERAYLSGGSFQRHRANNHSFAYGLHLVGDYANGNIYELDTETYTDDSQEIRRERIGPHISNSEKRIRYNAFQLETETGSGLSQVTQGHDPKIILQYSDDGGYTWSNEKLASLGKLAKRKTRVIWRRLGMSRDRIFKVACSEPIKVSLIGAELDAVAMGH